MTPLSKAIQPPHKAASRVLGFALTLGDAEAWEAASLVWQARLSPDERAAAALSFLGACEADHAARIADTIKTDAGPPVTPLSDMAGEAVLWADIASTAERKAYIVAAWSTLHPTEQSAFLSKIAGRQAA